MTFQKQSLICLVLLLTACSGDKFAENKTARNLQVDVQDASPDAEKGSGDATATDDKTSKTVEVDILDQAGGKADPDSTAEVGGAKDPDKGGMGGGKGPDKDPNGNDKEGGKECGAMVGVERVKISGSENKETVSSTEAYWVKVTGNQNVLNLELKAATVATKLPGLCLDIAGNLNSITVNVQLQLGVLYVKARGNQAKIDLSVIKDAAIGAMKINAAGHAPLISVTGAGTFPCENALVKGDSSNLSCKATP